MKQKLKEFVRRFPTGESLYLKFRAYKNKRLSQKTLLSVFTQHYSRNLWGNSESVSGPGSSVEYTANLRKELPMIIRRYGVRRFLDAPCGDYNWFRLVPRDQTVQYIGGDIVDELVKTNSRLYGNRKTQFVKLDITRDALPEADLWMCRDCLFHLPERDIFRVLHRLANSHIKLFFTSIHPNTNFNSDIAPGQFRLLNLRLPPFNFGEPILLVDDWLDGYPVRQMGLWKTESLLRDLQANKWFEASKS